MYAAAASCTLLMSINEVGYISTVCVGSVLVVNAPTLGAAWSHIFSVMTGSMGRPCDVLRN